MKFVVDEQGDIIAGDGIACICPHSPPGYRVGYDWGRLAWFPTLKEAKRFCRRQRLFEVLTGTLERAMFK